MKWNVALVLVVFSAVALAGCSSAKPEKPEPREYTSVPLYMAGQEIPADSQEKYLTNASIKMYSVGRLVDPGSGTMREAGTVYRIETAPQWNLIPQYDANPEAFARMKLQEQYADSMLGQMNRSLSETRDVKHGLDAVQKNMSEIEEKHLMLTQENVTLKTELQKQKENMVNLLDGIRKMQKYIELLELQLKDRNTMGIGGER